MILNRQVSQPLASWSAVAVAVSRRTDTLIYSGVDVNGVDAQASGRGWRLKASRSVITLSWLGDIESNARGVISYGTSILELGYACNSDLSTDVAGRAGAW